MEINQTLLKATLCDKNMFMYRKRHIDQAFFGQNMKFIFL